MAIPTVFPLLSDDSYTYDYDRENRLGDTLLLVKGPDRYIIWITRKGVQSKRRVPAQLIFGKT
jgi:hypothetical protein